MSIDIGIDIDIDIDVVWGGGDRMCSGYIVIVYMKVFRRLSYTSSFVR